MNRLYRSSAALLVAALLAGCGAQTIGPVSATSVAAMSLRAQAVAPADPQVPALIAEFKSISGYDDAAMLKRTEIVNKLGQTDSDTAATFLQAEYEHLAAYPDAVRPTIEEKIIDALLTLDTYDAEQDEESLKVGPGQTLVQMESYYDAATRQARHKGFIHWVSTPFRWVGKGIKRFFQGLTGQKPKRSRGGGGRRPSPGGGSGNMPVSGPNGGGFGGGNYGGSGNGGYGGSGNSGGYPY
jgi:hypothetical protein